MLASELVRLSLCWHCLRPPIWVILPKISNSLSTFCMLEICIGRETFQKWYLSWIWCLCFLVICSTICVYRKNNIFLYHQASLIIFLDKWFNEYSCVYIKFIFDLRWKVKRFHLPPTSLTLHWFVFLFKQKNRWDSIKWGKLWNHRFSFDGCRNNFRKCLPKDYLVCKISPLDD